MKKAGYTVEAVFVFSICLWVLLALIYGSFYIHDRMIVGSVTGEMAAERFQRGEKDISAQWEKEVKQKLSDALYLMQIQKVEAKRGLSSVEIEVKYKIPISISGIKSLFTDKNKKDTFVIQKELPKPMEYKWDADLLKEK